MTGVNLLIYKLTTIMNFPLASTATNFDLLIIQFILKPKPISLTHLPPARNVEILSGQLTESEKRKIDATPE